jgi:peptide/nickel transport system substrate-binding protein
MNQSRRLRHWRLLSVLALIALLAAACGPAAAPGAATAPQQEAAPAAGAEAAASEPVEMGRGVGGTLRILYWQAPTILNTHLATGTKDYDASRLILEPLAGIAPDGSLVPLLVEEIPTVENGSVAEDGSWITWKLRDDILWSDGTPFTAEDVVFTYDYCSNAETACTNAAYLVNIESVEAVDDHTVTITWNAATSNPYFAFTSTSGRILQKAQFANCIGAAASSAEECQQANLAPIGTGPYKLVEFKPGDVVTYEINEHYRDADKPFFQEVIFKGGGDATSAARAVLQTGDTDWAWNLQVEAAVLTQLADQGGAGELVIYNTGNVERLLINFTDVNPDLGDERGQLSHPHPFLTDINVRQALSLAIDNAVIAEQLYGPTGLATCELLWYEPYTSSQEEYFGGRHDCSQNLEEANRLLDEAGWEMGSDGVRSKDGMRLSVLFQTSVNPLRQKTQELIKQWWEEIGVETELKSVDAGVFFGSDAGNPDNIGHFFADIQMYTTGAGEPDAIAHLCQYVSAEASQAENEWRGNNNMRWQNEEFDATCEQALTSMDADERRDLALKLNDLIVEDYAMIPLVARPRVAGAVTNLRGYEPSGWDSEMWDIANWYME